MRIRVLLGVVILSNLAGCAGQRVPEPNPVVTMQCFYPVIAPLPETKELQAKGGINISLAPGNFQCSKAVQKTS